LQFISTAQPIFIDKAQIEFEVKSNNHKSFDSWFSNSESETSWQENYKSNVSKYTISYYDFLFSDNKSIYSFTKLDEKNKSQWDNEINYEGNIWYLDHNTGTAAYKKKFLGR
jgi:hypothetical protein